MQPRASCEPVSRGAEKRSLVLPSAGPPSTTSKDNVARLAQWTTLSRLAANPKEQKWEHCLMF